MRLRYIVSMLMNTRALLSLSRSPTVSRPEFCVQFRDATTGFRSYFEACTTFSRVNTVDVVSQASALHQMCWVEYLNGLQLGSCPAA